MTRGTRVAVSVILLGGLVSVIFLASLALRALPQRSRGVALGQRAPDFTLETLDGTPVTLSRLHGKVVFVNFWASWCHPCQEEMPGFEKFYTKHKSDQWALLAVNVEEKSARENVASFVKDRGYTFPVLLDPDGKVANEYSVTGIPVTFVVAPEGKVVHVLEGSIYDVEAELGKYLPGAEQGKK